MERYNRWSFFAITVLIVLMPGCFLNSTFQTAQVTVSAGEEVSQGTGPNLETPASIDIVDAFDIDVGLQPQEQYVVESAWAEDHKDPAHGTRSKKPFGVLLGLASIKGIYLGGQYTFAGTKCVQVTFGNVPFVELAGYKASTVSITVNHYLSTDRMTSPYISVAFSFETLTSLSDEPLGNLYWTASNLGLDWRWRNGMNLFISAGPAIGGVHPVFWTMS
jgi:hypothetical protein